MILIVSFILVFIGALSLINYHFNKNPGFLLVGLILTLFTLAFGFGLAGNLFPVSEQKILQTEWHYSKLENSVTVESGDRTEIFKDAKTYNMIDKNCCELYLVRKYNSYGSIIIEYFEIKKY